MTNPNIGRYGRKFKPKDGTCEVLGKRNFSFRLPVDVEEALFAMPQAERIALIRGTITKAVRGE